jgi:hypothetical protein
MRRLIAVLAFAALTLTASPALAQEVPEYGQGPGVRRATTLPHTGGDQLPVVAPTDPTADPWPLLAVALTFGVAGFALDARLRGRREDD